SEPLLLLALPDLLLDPFARLAFPELFFNPFARGDIVGDRRDANDAPRRVTDGRERERDIDPRAVPAAPNRLLILDPLAPPDPVVEPGELVTLLQRNDHRDRLTDRLLARVT